ncbi:MAG: hypothetical protein E6Q97_17995 [Desulfurellales bacterium]|nr:MAG: hypothetical protein E6Q97_17995 [Desulfurellales bacterium]
MSNEIVNVQERIAQQLALQQEQAAGLRTTGNFISFKNGNMKVNGQPVPNNTAEIRIFAVIPERAWYDGGFDPDSPQSPACYSLGTSGVPHPEAASPVAATCKDCPKNKWGTAPPRPGSDKPGRGKACRESARVICSPAALNIKSAPLYQAKFPVTSLSTVDAFVNRCNQMGKLYGEFINTMNVIEDKKSFFKIHLTIKELSSDLDPAEVLLRQEEAIELAMEPYPVFED